MSGPLLGHAEAGMVAAAFGVQASVVSGGVLCVIGVILCGALLPRFVGYDARAWVRSSEETAPSAPASGLPPSPRSEP